MAEIASSRSASLRRDHPVATVFLDETGSISGDRFFAIGGLKLEEPGPLLRRVQKLRDVYHWYDELKFTSLTRKAVPFYQQVIDEVASEHRWEFYCFVADRQKADPIDRFGSQWDAYAKLAEQLVTALIHRSEIVTVLADYYSAPAGVQFEQVLRQAVNRRLARLGVVSVCCLNSNASDGLQLVDLLTGAVAFEFRQELGNARVTSPKGAASGARPSRDGYAVVPGRVAHRQPQRRCVRPRHVVQGVTGRLGLLPERRRVLCQLGVGLWPLARVLCRPGLRTGSTHVRSGVDRFAIRVEGYVRTVRERLRDEGWFGGQAQAVQA